MPSSDPRIGSNSGGATVPTYGDAGGEAPRGGGGDLNAADGGGAVNTEGVAPQSTRREEADASGTTSVERRALLIVPWFPGPMLTFPDLRIGVVHRYLVG